MRAPFHLFCGPELGDHRSTNPDLLPSRNLATNQTSIGVNATNGNTVFRDTEFSIADDDFILKIGMVWNSFDQQWRFAAKPRIIFNQSMLRSVRQMLRKQELKIEEADGRTITYAFDADRQAFVSKTSDENGKSILIFNKDMSYERFFPASGVREYFDKTGELTKKTLPTGKEIIYHDQSITLPSGRQVNLENDSKNTRVKHLVLSNNGANGTQLVLADYEADNWSRPTHLTTRMEKSGKAPYQTTYNMVKTASGFDAYIDSTDHTTAVISFNQHGIINRLLEGKKIKPLRTWSFALDARNKIMTMIDPDNRPYQINFDHNNHLSRYKSPANIATDYQFNKQAQLQTVTDAENNSNTYIYEPHTGLISSKCDSLGRTTRYIYQTDIKSPLFGLKLAVIHQDHSQKNAVYYVYNEKRQRIFKISGEGRVTRYIYEDKDKDVNDNITNYQHKSVKKYKVSTKYFSLRDIDIDKIQTLPTEKSMVSWWNNTLTPDDLARCQLTTYGFDHCGRANEETEYTSLDQQGNGIKTLDCREQKKILDPVGNLLQQDTLKQNSYKNTTFERIAHQYDQLNRVTLTTEGNQKNNSLTRRTARIYSNNKTTIAHQNGLVETLTIDEGGLIKEKTSGDWKKISQRTETIQRHGDGSVRCIIHSDGQKEYHFKNAKGQLAFKYVYGKLEEYFYDGCGKRTCRQDYAITLLNPEDPNIDLQSVVKQHAASLSAYNLFDSEEQLCFEVFVKNVIDEQGACRREGRVTQNEYTLGNKTKVIEYALPLVGNELQNLSYDKLATKFSENDRDRETRYFYDHDNLLIGEQTLTDWQGTQPLGFSKRYDRDACGRVYHEAVYLEKTPLSDKFSIACPEQAKTLDTWHWYDSAREIATLDPDNYMITFKYYANGKIRGEYHYKEPIIIAAKIKTEFSLDALPPPDFKRDQCLEYDYDDLGRKNYVINHLTQLETRIKYDRADNITAVKQKDLKTGKTRTLKKIYNIFSEIEKEATTRIYATVGKDLSQWISYDHDPITGLLRSTTDALGHKTLFYYDENREPALKIMPNGAVVLFENDPLCHKPTLIYEYYNKLSSKILVSLQNDKERNGFISDKVIKILPAKNEQKDKTAKFKYNGEGFVYEETASNGANLKSFYNSFNEIRSQQKQIEDKRILTTNFLHDLRGNQETVIQDPTDLNIVNQIFHDDPLSRPTLSVSALGDETTHAYEGLRKERLKTKGNSKTVVKDALFRVLDETDWLDNHTKHFYEDAERKHTVVSAENRAIAEITNAFGETEQQIEGSRISDFKHGADGKLEECKNADNSIEIFSHNLMGWKVGYKALNGKITLYIPNEVEQTKTVIENVEGDKRITNIDPHSFGEDETITHSDGQVVKTELNNRGCSREKITDPAGLQLFTKETLDLAGNIFEIQKGTVSEPNQYQERIKRDVLGRERERLVVMENLSTLTLKNQQLNAAGGVLKTTDSKGNMTRQGFDKQGNVILNIDAEGYVTEFTYNANRKECWRCRYGKPLTQEQINKLPDNPCPNDIDLTALINGNEQIRQRIYDNDSLLSFELNVIAPGNHCIGKLTGWERNEHGEKVEYKEYAKPVSYEQYGLVNRVISIDQIKSLVLSPEFKDHPENRVISICRNLRGRSVFKRDGENYVLEKRRDVNGQVIAYVQYADKYPHVNFRQDPASISNALNKDNPANSTVFCIYDLYKNLKYKIDGEGFVIEYKYDSENRPKGSRNYYYKLSDKLTPDDIKKLYADLSQGGPERDVNAILKTMSEVTQKIADKEKDADSDVIYDKGGRITDKIDGRRNVEKFIPNALGFNEQRIDKCKNRWSFKFDRAKRLISEFCPPIELTKITKQADGQDLKENPLGKIPVETKYEYQQGFKSEKVIFAANVKNDERVVNKIINKNDQVIGTQVFNVNVDDPDQTPSNENDRPEKHVKVIETKVVKNNIGNPIVQIDESGAAKFSVYDGLERDRFLIDGEGHIIEFQYDTALPEPSKMLQHGAALPKAVLEQHKETGFSLAEISGLVQQLDPKDTRTITFTHDRRGLQTSATSDEVITGKVDAEGNTQSVLFRPEKSWQYDAFHNIVKENIHLHNGKLATTRFFYDHNRNQIMLITPLGYVTQQTFGMHSTKSGDDNYLLYKCIERAQPLPKEIDWDNLQTIHDHLQPPAGKDRVHDFSYNKNSYLLQELVSSEEELFYRTIMGNDGVPVRVPVGNSIIAQGYEYDEEDRIIAYVLSTGEKRYIELNERGDLCFETDFPMATNVDELEKGQPKTHIPVTRHLVNAHKQHVGTVRYFNEGKIENDKQNKTKILAPAESSQDQKTLLLHDGRGNAVITRTSEGHLKFATFSPNNKLMRNYHWVTEYVLDVNEQPVAIKELHSNQIFTDNCDNIVHERQTTGNEVVDTYKTYNAFKECIGEGPAPNKMILERLFDKTGFKWYTNEDKGIPTIAFPDENGVEVVMFRSPIVDLAKYKSKLHEASQLLLNGNYADLYQTYQRTGTLRDIEGNVLVQFMPWFRRRPKDAPQNLQMSFTQIQADHKAFITWKPFDEIFLKAEFRIRCKGSENWENIDIPLGATSVDVSHLQTDTYEYQLDLKVVDQQTGTVDELPSYRAEGETVVVTEHNENAKNLSWYMPNDYTLVLCGKTAGVTGIELWKDNKPVKRIAALAQADGTFRVDLSNEVSGDYQFKAVLSYQLGEQVALNYFQPQYRFTSNDTLSTIPGTLPPEIVSLENVVIPQPPLPVHRLTFSVKTRHERYDKEFGPAAGVPAAYAFGKDSQGNRYYLGTFITAPYPISDMYNFYNGQVDQLATFNGEPFYLLRDNSANHPDAVILYQNGVVLGCFPIATWAGGAYIIPGVREPSGISAVKVSIQDAPVTNHLGTLPIRTLHPSSNMVAQNITVNDLQVNNYLIGGYIYQNPNPKPESLSTYFNYNWVTNVPGPTGLIASYDDVSNYIMNYQTPWTFQQLLPSVRSPGILSVDLNMPGFANIPIARGLRPNPIAIDGGRQTIMYTDLAPGDQFVKYDARLLNIARYEDSNIIYLHPFPANAHTIEIECAKEKITGEKTWEPLPAIWYNTGCGLVIFANTVLPGDYEYRIKAKDVAGQSIDFSIFGLKLNQTNKDDDWTYGNFTLKKGKANHLVFFSKSKSADEAKELCKPQFKMAYTRWRQPSAVTNRSNNTTSYEYNLINKEASNKTPETESKDEHDINHTGRLTTEKFYNTDQHMIAEIAPNGAEKTRYVNHQGDTLRDCDADSIYNTYVYDLLRRRIAAYRRNHAPISTDYKIENHLLVETRHLPDNLNEVLVYNEEGHLIKHDLYGKSHFYKRDVNGRDLLHIFAKANRQPYQSGTRTSPTNKFIEEKQAFHPRSGARTLFKDIDGIEQIWDTNSNSDDVDNYFGNVTAYTDMAKQRIEYRLNHNKQITEEKGSVNDEINSRRGHAHNGERPPAKHLLHVLDETGHEVEVIDIGAQLRTMKRYDMDDYCEGYYFTNSDGRVYQATYATYDTLHRIVRLYDTHLMVYLSHDENGNRRAALAYAKDTDPTQFPAIKQSWYKYTPAGRVLLRDGVLNEENKNIEITPAQGMQLAWENGDVVGQDTLSLDGKKVHKKLDYTNGLLTNIATTRDGELVANVQRVIENGHCKIIIKTQFEDIFIQQYQPEKSTYFKYELPTYVLSINDGIPQLFYYHNAEKTEVMIFHIEGLGECVRRKKVELLTEEEINHIKGLISNYHRAQHGVFETDITELDVDNSTVEHRHIEGLQDGESENTVDRRVMQKTLSGLPEVEVIKNKTMLNHETGYEFEDQLTSEYALSNDAKVSKVTAQRLSQKPHGDIKLDAIPKPATVNMTFNSNGSITSAQGALPDSYLSLVVNSENCIVLKQSDKGKNYYFYAEKRPGKTVLMAYFGDLPQGLKTGLKAGLTTSAYNPPVMNVDVNHKPLSDQYPPSLPSEFTTSRAMTYEQIAEELNYTGFAAAIAQANNADVNDVVPANYPVNIPPLYFEVPETAWNGALPSIEQIIGNLYPTLPSPHISYKTPKVNWVEVFLEAAAFAAIMSVAPQAIAGALGWTLGAANATLTATEVAHAMVAYGAAAAMANTASQGIAMTAGSQKAFNVESLVASTLSSAVSGGVLAKFGQLSPGGVPQMQNFNAATVGKTILAAETVAAAQQAALMLTGLQSKFDPRALGVAAFNASVGKALSGVENTTLNAGANALVDTIGDDLITGRDINAKDVSAITLGTMVGTFATSKVAENLHRKQQQNAAAAKSANDEIATQNPLAEYGEQDYREVSAKKGEQLAVVKNPEEAEILSKLKPTMTKNTARPKPKEDHMTSITASRAKRWQEEQANRGSWQDKTIEPVFVSPENDFNYQDELVNIAKYQLTEMNRENLAKQNSTNSYINQVLNSVNNLGIDLVANAVTGGMYKGIKGAEAEARDKLRDISAILSNDKEAKIGAEKKLAIEGGLLLVGGPIGRATGKIVYPISKVIGKLFKEGEGVAKYSFKLGEDVAHFEKHGAKVAKKLGETNYDVQKYVQDANHVINEGIYVPELHGYVKIPTGPGSAQAPFVGLDRITNEITTFHLKPVSFLEKNAPSLGWQAKPKFEITDLIGQNRELGWRSPYRRSP